MTEQIYQLAQEYGPFLIGGLGALIAFYHEKATELLANIKLPSLKTKTDDGDYWLKEGRHIDALAEKLHAAGCPEAAKCLTGEVKLAMSRVAFSLGDSVK